MWRTSRSRKAISLVLLPVLLAQVSGCAEWMNYQQPPGEVLARKSPGKVRVLHADGTSRDVHAPRVVNDTLVGYRSAAGGAMQSADGMVRIPVSEIKRMEVRQTNTGGTILLVALGVGLVAVVAVAASIDFMDGFDPFGGCQTDCGGDE